MLKIKLIPIILLTSLIMIGCQSNNLNLKKDVSSIEVYEWDSDTLVTTIEDKEFIDELVNELNRANTGSTANMDFDLPDFKLYFKNDYETLFEIGYYNNVMNLGVEGRYWDYREDKMYSVELQLPIE